MQPLLWQLQISMVYRNAQNTGFTMSTDQNPGSKLQFSDLSLKTQRNLECKPQLETRKVPISSISLFSSEGLKFLLQADTARDLLNYHVNFPHAQNEFLIGGKNKEEMEVVTHIDKGLGYRRKNRREQQRKKCSSDLFMNFYFLKHSLKSFSIKLTP